MSHKRGIAGAITAGFINSPLTPLILIASLFAGLIAFISLPREEEPQISVPMVDIFISADGLKAEDAAELVTKPMEEIIEAIDGVEHVYSQTQDNKVVVTARFFVGTNEDDAILRVHENIRANMSRIPIGIPEPLIVGRGINDVPIVTLTLSPDADAAEYWTDNSLYLLADELQSELMQVDDIGTSFITGGRPSQLRIEPNPEMLSLYGITLDQLIEKIRNANNSFIAGSLRENNQSYMVIAGETLQNSTDIGLLLLTSHDGRPIYVRDVANITMGVNELEHYVWNINPITENGTNSLERVPAVTIAFSKRAGANAVNVAADINARIDNLSENMISAGINLQVTRDYGATAKEKADSLMHELISATIVIVLLISVAVGWREGFTVLVVVPTTILLTMLASYLMGFTLNRVSLFALIFSIGILVDDAIVVVENAVRHWEMNDNRSRTKATIDAVAEIGNPTIFATFTVIMALLPMLFVSGLMGPYMSPIPANASAAMFFSLVVALVITPWLLIRLSRKANLEKGENSENDHSLIGRIYIFIAAPLLKTKLRSFIFLMIIGIITLASFLLIINKNVTVKLLPFDNKSELQIVLDMPEGTSLEETDRTLFDIATYIADLPELVNIQSHAGTAAPFNFNGLVRHYFLRAEPYMGDLQINLLPKDERDRESHDIALDIRERLSHITNLPDGANIKLVEVPPGPPVLSTLLAEIYSPDTETSIAIAEEVQSLFETVPFIVDIDNSIGNRATRMRIIPDQDSLEFFGIEQEALYGTIDALMGGVSVGYSHRGDGRNPIEISIETTRDSLNLTETILSTPIPSNNGPVELGDVVSISEEQASYDIFRRNGHNIIMVTAELAGEFESPIYGILEVNKAIENHDWGNLPQPKILFHGQPDNQDEAALLWDGEWEITYVTFRDMGLAFAGAILGIYLIIVWQFSSYKLPLVILTPVPLTLVGILLGHYLLHAAFTATSMIGFIALAGIMVRNSILLVDFILMRREDNIPLRQALIEAGAIRFKPILLTSLTAMIGAGFILADPIFNGLAISLLFGLASSTLLTVLVIPAIYVLLRDDKRPWYPN